METREEETRSGLGGGAGRDPQFHAEGGPHAHLLPREKPLQGFNSGGVLRTPLCCGKEGDAVPSDPTEPVRGPGEAGSRGQPQDSHSRTGLEGTGFPGSRPDTELPGNSHPGPHHVPPQSLLLGESQWVSWRVGGGGGGCHSRWGRGWCVGPRPPSQAPVPALETDLSRDGTVALLRTCSAHGPRGRLPPRKLSGWGQDSGLSSTEITCTPSLAGNGGSGQRQEGG